LEPERLSVPKLEIIIASRGIRKSINNEQDIVRKIDFILVWRNFIYVIDVRYKVLACQEEYDNDS
jgi:hypothetical protein